jgi:hypothetical protein
MVKSLLVVALLVGCLPAAATAQVRAGTPEEQKACAKDVARHCRENINDPDLVVLVCLQQHRAELSQACNKVLVDHGQ